MNFSYNKNNGKYVLGQTEYTQDEFINYIQADMLKNALAKDSSFNIIVENSKKSSEERKEEIYTKLLSYPIPCIVFCRELEPDELFLKKAIENNVPLFKTKKTTSAFMAERSYLCAKVAF